MRKLIAGIVAVVLAASALTAGIDPDDGWRKAEANGKETQKIIKFCNRYAWGWLSQADPETGLLPRNLSGAHVLDVPELIKFLTWHLGPVRK